MAQTCIGDMLAPAERGRYQGMLSSVIAVSAIAGPVVGGLFTTYWTWRGIFWLNLPFCGLSAVMIALKLGKLTIRARHVTSVRDVDWLGSMLVVAATVALIMPLVWGGSTYSWGAGQIVGLLAAFGVLTVVFVLSEGWFGLKANLPLHMFKVRNFTLCILIRFFSGAVLYGLVRHETHCTTALREAHRCSAAAHRSRVVCCPLRSATCRRTGRQCRTRARRSQACGRHPCCSVPQSALWLPVSLSHEPLAGSRCPSWAQGCRCWASAC
jgi:hypothetical protein